MLNRTYIFLLSFLLFFSFAGSLNGDIFLNFNKNITKDFSSFFSSSIKSKTSCDIVLMGCEGKMFSFVVGQSVSEVVNYFKEQNISVVFKENNLLAYKKEGANLVMVRGENLGTFKSRWHFLRIEQNESQ